METWKGGDMEIRRWGMANGVNERWKVWKMEKWKYWKMDIKRDGGIKRFNKI